MLGELQSTMALAYFHNSGSATLDSDSSFHVCLCLSTRILCGQPEGWDRCKCLMWSVSQVVVTDASALGGGQGSRGCAAGQSKASRLLLILGLVDLFLAPCSHTCESLHLTAWKITTQVRCGAALPSCQRTSCVCLWQYIKRSQCTDC